MYKRQVEDSAVYLHIYFGGMVFNLVYNMGAAILRAVGAVSYTHLDVYKRQVLSVR